MKESYLEKAYPCIQFHCIYLFLSILPGYADTLTLTGVGSGQTTPAGSEYVGPYQVSVNGNPVDMFCLDLNRNVSLGQTWQTDREVVSTLSTFDVKTAAYIFASTMQNPYLIQSNLDAQMEIWAITDLAGAKAQGLTTSEFDTLAFIQSYVTMDFLGNDVLKQFTLEKAQANSDGSFAQDFIGPSDPIAVTPEPSSLLLMGTGLVSSIGMFYRKMRTA